MGLDPCLALKSWRLSCSHTAAAAAAAESASGGSLSPLQGGEAAPWQVYGRWTPSLSQGAAPRRDAEQRKEPCCKKEHQTFQQGLGECVTQEVFHTHSSERTCKGSTAPVDVESVNAPFLHRAAPSGCVLKVHYVVLIGGQRSSLTGFSFYLSFHGGINWINNQRTLKVNTLLVCGGPCHLSSSVFWGPSFPLRRACLLSYEKNNVCVITSLTFSSPNLQSAPLI